MVYVTKYDGRSQKFEKEKIIRTCMRMGATQEIAEDIAGKIEARLYDGISTKKIMSMIFSYMKKHMPELKHTIDLRKSISMLRPKPDFELFVAHILRAHGYKVRSNMMIGGKCVEYEVDAVAEKAESKTDKKEKEIIFVEVKHHYKPHTYTGMGVFLETYAKFLDLIDGYKSGSNNIKFNKVMVVCNTKISNHARRYSKCRKIMHIGWKAPVDYGLEQMIEKKKLHPITFLKDLSPMEQNKLGDAGIVTIKQILKLDINELARMTKISKKRLKELKIKGKKVLST